MDSNERIAVALERIANYLEFFVELAKKEEEDFTDVVKVEEEVPGTIDTDPLYFARRKDIYDN